ncbi:MAG TPA: outer membrane beta-barrel protein [Cyclobacteriaceae bacterium]|nr:outer membrane beta-barrel protein [Cyclobacteriaceae bacterium]
MKKVYALILSLASLTAYAQQQAGDLSIQFSGNFNTSKYKIGSYTNKNFNGNIYVKIGKFFTQNIELGLKPNIFFFTEQKANPNDSKDVKYSLKSNFGLGLYGTYSFLTPGAKFLPYAGAEVNYLPLGEDAAVNLGPYAGCKYFLTEKINIDANLNCLVTLASTFGNDLQSVHFSPTWQFNVGIGVIISKDNP